MANPTDRIVLNLGFVWLHIESELHTYVSHVAKVTISRNPRSLKVIYEYATALVQVLEYDNAYALLSFSIKHANQALTDVAISISEEQKDEICLALRNCALLEASLRNAALRFDGYSLPNFNNARVELPAQICGLYYKFLSDQRRPSHLDQILRYASYPPPSRSDSLHTLQWLLLSILEIYAPDIRSTTLASEVIELGDRIGGSLREIAIGMTMFEPQAVTSFHHGISGLTVKSGDSSLLYERLRSRLEDTTVMTPLRQYIQSVWCCLKDSYLARNGDK